jgi:hypothetical protein
MAPGNIVRFPRIQVSELYGRDSAADLNALGEEPSVARVVLGKSPRV